MANDAYTKALKEVLTDTSPAAPTSQTKAELEIAIQAISDQLKKPLPNWLRLDLVEERQALRKQLEKSQ